MAEGEDIRIRCPQCGEWFGATPQCVLVDGLLCEQCDDAERQRAENEWQREQESHR